MSSHADPIQKFVRDTVSSVRQLYSARTSPFSAGFDLACEEILTRLDESWGKPNAAPQSSVEISAQAVAAPEAPAAPAVSELWSTVVYADGVSTEPLEVIRANECEYDDGLVTSRFRALWNEIQRLRRLTIMPRMFARDCPDCLGVGEVPCPEEISALRVTTCGTCEGTGDAPTTMDVIRAVVERMRDYPSGSYLRCGFCPAKSAGTHTEKCLVTQLIKATDTAPQEDMDLRTMGDMIILCGEEECRDLRGYAAKLRALIDGLIEAKLSVPDAQRFRAMLKDPEGARHLLYLLQQGKGNEESFRKMVDRIDASREVARG